MKTALFMLCFAFITAFAGPAKAGAPIYTGIFSNTAVSGYDTVSYFSPGGPVEGKSDFSTKWKGATWKFANASNLEKFKANPEKYAPQYGGYCAYAVAQDTLAYGDPKQWHIKDGKLYLNLSSSIKKKWLANRDEFIVQADQKFSGLID